MKKPSFAMQASAVRDMVSHCKRCGHYGEQVISWAEQASTTLDALAQYEDWMREAWRLGRENPALVKVLQAFPGAKLVDVRETDGD